MMKYILIPFLLWSCAFSQPYTAQWTGNAATYQLQRSSDNKNWKIMSNLHSRIYTTPGASTYYWRIKFIDPDRVWYSNTVWVYSLATITNAKFRSGIISWRAYGENNVSYYTVENDVGFTIVPKKTGGQYSVKVNGTGYKINAKYKNGDLRILKTF